MNKITKIIGILILFFFVSILLSLSIFSNITVDEITVDEITVDEITVDEILQSFFHSHTVKMKNNLDFDTYFTENDVIRHRQNLPFMDEIRFEFPADKVELYKKLKANENTIVIFPIFTAAAYSENGFYDYYAGNCDERCLKNISFENPTLNYESSGVSTQILHSVGYDFITDIDVDKNPEILQKYETVILLHNEYVTQKMFDAITSHPKLIFLSPNALYAEIEVNYDNNTIELIRGHDYPSGVLNAFDYEVEERFHKYEYSECVDWEFIEFENGYALNCYPDGAIHTNVDLIAKIKDL